MKDFKEAAAQYYTDSGIELVTKVWESIIKVKNVDEKNDFLKKFKSGYENRPSIRHSKPSNTIPDPIIDTIIHARMPKLASKDIELIRFGHRLSMAAENILGLMLEEYIHTKVLKFGWSCCWGNCIKAVDFCSENGILLQVKNRSNTENSSSNKIREGTEIIKWYRVNATSGACYWNELNTIIGKAKLTNEDDFQEYCKSLITRNPYALAIEDQA